MVFSGCEKCHGQILGESSFKFDVLIPTTPKWLRSSNKSFESGGGGKRGNVKSGDRRFWKPAYRIPQPKRHTPLHIEDTITTTFAPYYSTKHAQHMKTTVQLEDAN